jgi:hypothetical protein
MTHCSVNSPELRAASDSEEIIAGVLELLDKAIDILLALDLTLRKLAAEGEIGG